MLEKFVIVAILFVTGCSYTQPYVTNISPAGKNRILVEKCKMQRNQLFLKIILFAAIATFFWVQTDEMEETNNFSIDKFTFINKSFNVSGVYRPILAFI